LIVKGDVFDLWTVKQVDDLGRRAVCVCARCGAARTLSTESLNDRSAKPCDCCRGPIDPARFKPAPLARRFAKDMLIAGQRSNWRWPR
jgi:hypothetical protein